MSEERLTAVVITVSDRASAGEAEDRSGPIAADLLRSAGFACGEPVVTPDGADAVEATLREAVATGARLVLTTGGTGIGPRDATPEGTGRVLVRDVPGIVEEIRRVAATETAGGMLSRGLAGIAAGPSHEALVVNVAGSTAAVRSAVPIVVAVAPHAIAQLDGGGHA